jgi:hypothetical protein
VMSPPSKQASTWRRLQAGNVKDSWVHSVTGKALFEFNLSN